MNYFLRFMIGVQLVLALFGYEYSTELWYCSDFVK